MDTPITHSPTIVNRIAALRDAMKREGIYALLVPSSDPHLSEYLPERWKSREWLSGFTGSMGTLVVTLDRALLFADSRYWQQAERELAGTGISLFKIKSGASQEHVDWLAANTPANYTVAVDGAVLGVGAMRALAIALRAQDVTLRSDCDAIAAVWQDRPALPHAPVYAHTGPHATIARHEKLAATRAATTVAGANWHFISTLDDIGYLFNLRGSDVNFNPVFVAHALISQTDATLFVMPGKIPPGLAAELKAGGVNVAPYDEAGASLAGLSAGATLLIDPRRITHRMREMVPANVKVIEAVNPTTFAKSRKTLAERDYVRRTMEQDGAAMAEFYAWFEDVQKRAQGTERITEVTIDEKLTEARARREGFVSRSFATIAGFKANGALNHYRAVAATAAVIEGDGLLLIDSGGQYLGGTTDITRVWPIGNPAAITAEQKRDYTLVLKGTIALSVARFPKGVKSPYLDAIARAPIWAAGFDYGHGTGHGVGYFMNVHEGPQSISQAMPEPHTAMEEGMITSIEPGLYRDGKWGIRIENLVLNVSAGNEGFGDFLKFETLTLCPIDTHLIDVALLRRDEIDWLNAYHAEVARRLLPLLSGDAKAWLERRTQPLTTFTGATCN
jgi:Xaa-Pro aminopeptidase